MITLLLLALSSGPALRLDIPAPDGTPIIVALDSSGTVATRIACPRNQWVAPDDAAAKLIGSRTLLATVIAKNGSLTELDDLGPGKFDCVIVPVEDRR